MQKYEAFFRYSPVEAFGLRCARSTPTRTSTSVGIGPSVPERVIREANAAQLQCHILAEGANGPTTPAADAILDQWRDDVFVIPDIPCNAGGVIVSYFEWVQDLQRLFWSEEQVLKQLEQILSAAFEQVETRAAAWKVSRRRAALSIGIEKVRASKRIRGLFP
jgi:glutamate dehydrogenase (NAD(P)+)